MVVLTFSYLFRSRVLVQGSLEYSTYIDESGSQRNSVSIIPGECHCLILAHCLCLIFVEVTGTLKLLSKWRGLVTNVGDRLM